MEFIKGFTYGFMSNEGDFLKCEAKQSMKLLKERTNINTIIIALSALQDTAQSVKIDYTGNHMVSDEELIDMIEYAKELGLEVILKPTVNVKDGTWRAYINFFDIDAPCEPKWSEWFKSYTEYQLHYAKIAEKTNCKMFILGCEMIQSERCEKQWRKLIQDVRKKYKGLITYNTDKYQEDHVKWWDALDVISSSGYYPINDFDKQLDRIEKVVKKYDKPFFFAEAGCPSRTGSSLEPNNWKLQGEVNLVEQEKYYEILFKKINERKWIRGLGLWDWSTLLYSEEEAVYNKGYDVFGKPAEKVIKDNYLLS